MFHSLAVHSSADFCSLCFCAVVLSRNHPVQTQESHAKSGKDAKVLDQPLVEITDQMGEQAVSCRITFFCLSSAAFATFA